MQEQVADYLAIVSAHAPVAGDNTCNGENILTPRIFSNPANSGINLILIRYAEMLLTYAEARIELDQIDQSVLDAINQVRQRPDVNMPPITGAFSQAEMRQIVSRERLEELAFEGLRFFDIRRWHIAKNVMPGKIYGMTYMKNGTANVFEVSFEKTFKANRDYLWPIPQKEVDLNPALTQNPNW